VKPDHSLATEDSGRGRTAMWKLAIAAAQNRAPDSQAAPLQADEEMHARCETPIGTEGRSDP
jgi:hypothetical protein